MRLPLLLPNLNAQSSKQIKLLWIGIGGDDPSVEAHQQLNAYLDSKGVKYTPCTRTNGTGGRCGIGTSPSSPC